MLFELTKVNTMFELSVSVVVSFWRYFLLMLSSKITIHAVHYLFQVILDHCSKYIYVVISFYY